MMTLVEEVRVTCVCLLQRVYDILVYKNTSVRLAIERAMVD